VRASEKGLRVVRMGIVVAPWESLLGRGPEGPSGWSSVAVLGKRYGSVVYSWEHLALEPFFIPRSGALGAASKVSSLSSARLIRYWGRQVVPGEGLVRTSILFPYGGSVKWTEVSLEMKGG
jgi:hypothetical protein